MKRLMIGATLLVGLSAVARDFDVRDFGAKRDGYGGDPAGG